MRIDGNTTPEASRCSCRSFINAQPSNLRTSSGPTAPARAVHRVRARGSSRREGALVRLDHPGSFQAAWKPPRVQGDPSSGLVHGRLSAPGLQWHWWSCGEISLGVHRLRIPVSRRPGPGARLSCSVTLPFALERVQLECQRSVSTHRAEHRCAIANRRRFTSTGYLLPALPRSVGFGGPVCFAPRLALTLTLYGFCCARRPTCRTAKNTFEGGLDDASGSGSRGDPAALQDDS